MRLPGDKGILPLLVLFGTVIFGAVFVFGNPFFDIEYEGNTATTTPPEEIKEEVLHIKMPDEVKAAYMTACFAGTPSLRKTVVDLIEETELNSIIIDIKDYTGTISFDTENPHLQNEGTGCRVSDMKEFVKELHEKGIYVIGRITVFQDPYYAKKHPELAVQSFSTGTPWKDHKGLSFIDVSARPYWDYIVELSKESYALGFDELNFDYIRFPSDGNMRDTHYVHSADILKEYGTAGKAEALKRFFAYLARELRGVGVVTSADLFGMTATNTDDLNIGQILEYALPYFDAIAPMVYPSHYPPNFNGWANPNDYPYEIVHFSMKKAADRFIAASSTPLKLRTWIQDFDYGGDYDIPEVRAQIKASRDAGVPSFMIWSPSNRYTKGALDIE